LATFLSQFTNIIVQGSLYYTEGTNSTCGAFETRGISVSYSTLVIMQLFFLLIATGLFLFEGPDGFHRKSCFRFCLSRWLLFWIFDSVSSLAILFLIPCSDKDKFMIYLIARFIFVFRDLILLDLISMFNVLKIAKRNNTKPNTTLSWGLSFLAFLAVCDVVSSILTGILFVVTLDPLQSNYAWIIGFILLEVIVVFFYKGFLSQTLFAKCCNPEGDYYEDSKRDPEFVSSSEKVFDFLCTDAQVPEITKIDHHLAVDLNFETSVKIL